MSNINKHIEDENHELVLSIPRSLLREQGIESLGVHTIDLGKLHPYAYAFLPRFLADNKSPNAVELGKMFPQLVGYFQIRNSEGRYLAYQRKGKEEGLFGKWSIGVGGHVSQEDLIYVDNTGEKDSENGNPPTLWDVLLSGMQRELMEEISLPLNMALFKPEDFKTCLASFDDVTSTVHVGLSLDIPLFENQLLRLDPKEFNNVKWLTQAELIAAHRDEEMELETWSRLLVESWVF